LSSPPGLLCLLFSSGRGRLGCFPFAAYCVSHKEPYDSSVSYLLVDCTPFSFPISPCMERCLIFAEPGLENLTSLVPCFQIEGSEFRLAAFTIVLVEAVCVAKWMVLVHERRRWENLRWNCTSMERIGFVSLKITELCDLRGWLYVITHSWFMATLQNLPIRGSAY